jgi:hypothetical protein
MEYIKYNIELQGLKRESAWKYSASAQITLSKRETMLPVLKVRVKANRFEVY